MTFSVVFAYVADVTDESERSSAYGLVSATFAASLVTSPALGAYLEQMYSEEVGHLDYKADPFPPGIYQKCWQLIIFK